MEPNKQMIDYGKLEWFDCENNFPPMNIDLYVDSEHGYGIGRLGKRVKNNSIIWVVHLDSGEVYLVYAFYKVKRWAYMPKDEKTNTKLKHELKAVHAFDVYEAYTKTGDDDAAQVYLKSEADKVIAEKDKEIAELNGQVNGFQNRSNLWHYNAVEEHKKFVQADLKITELKEKHKTEVKDLLCLIRDKENNFNRAFDSEEEELRHHKYKRCLAMAEACIHKRWRTDDGFDYARSTRHMNKWLAIAEKFKPNSTAQ